MYFISVCSSVNNTDNTLSHHILSFSQLQMVPTHVLNVCDNNAIVCQLMDELLHLV